MLKGDVSLGIGTGANRESIPPFKGTLHTFQGGWRWWFAGWDEGALGTGGPSWRRRGTLIGCSKQQNPSEGCDWQQSPRLHHTPSLVA
jgi:hypothetical protein